MWFTDQYFQKVVIHLVLVLVLLLDAFLSKKLDKLNCNIDYRNAEAFGKRFEKQNAPLCIGLSQINH